MEEETYLDVPAIRNMARLFDAIGGVMRAVSAALQALMLVLQTTAFVGLVGGAAVEHYIARIQPEVKRLADLCEEMSRDVDTSVDAYERGDAAGATRFH
jgi:hypothetical protein